MKIGQKIPYVSGSLNSAVATPGSIPYATTQFQQVEVGTLIDLEPHVNGQDDISMHIRVELSTVLNQILIAGIEEPEIGQQIDEANIRMKDGEVSILGGLSDRERTRAYSGVPGFTNLPLLGYLFGTRTRTDVDQEVLIAIIPHIVRAPDLSDQANQGVYAGTDTVPRVERGAQPVQVSLPPVTGAPPVLPNAPRGAAPTPPATRAPLPSAPLPNPPTANVQFPAALPEPTVSPSQPHPQ